MLNDKRIINPFCNDSTAALTVACSFCVQSLSHPFCRRSHGVPTAAGRQQQQQRGRRRGQSGARASCDNFRGAGVGNGSSCINFWRLLRIVPRGATCWLRSGAVRTCAVLWNVCYTCVSYGWWLSYFLCGYYHGNAYFSRWQTMQKYIKLFA